MASKKNAKKTVRTVVRQTARAARANGNEDYTKAEARRTAKAVIRFSQNHPYYSGGLAPEFINPIRRLEGRAAAKKTKRALKVISRKSR